MSKTWTAKKWICKVTEKVAKTSKYDTFMHGSTICKSGRILGKGVNHSIRKMTKFQDSYSVHAEEAAIRDAGEKHCKNATIYVARWSSTGLRNSKPCNTCAARIKAVGIKQVVYSIATDEWGIKDP